MPQQYFYVPGFNGSEIISNVFKIATWYISLFTDGMPYLINYDPVTILNNQSQLNQSQNPFSSYVF